MEALLAVAWFLVLLVFFVPSLVAFQRGSAHRFVILIANLAVGWTGVGWLAVLAMAIWPRNDALPVRLTDDQPKSGGFPPSGGSPSGPPAGDLVGRLTQLSELKKAGILSDAEFDRKKREILSA